MEEFIKLLLNMSLAASFVIMVIILVRRLFSCMGVPKKYAYLLWLLPFIRMVSPWSLESNMSLLPDMTQIVEYAAREDAVSGATLGMGNGVSGAAPDLRNGVSDTPSNGKSPESDTKYYGNKDDLSNQQHIQNDGVSAGKEDNIPLESGFGSMPPDVIVKDAGGSHNNVWWILGGIWLTGIAGIVFYSAANYIKLKKRLDASFLIRDNIYIHDDIETAFVAGCFRPYIYLPSGLSERDMEYIISHEQVHITRRDYQIKSLAFLAVTIHWFNPMCWLAFALLGKDMEMSCDEAVIDKMVTEDKKAYANVLLHMAAGKRRSMGMQLTFAEGNPKERIKNIMKNKKPVVAVSLLAVMIVAVLAGTLLTNPKIQGVQDSTMQEASEEQNGTTKEEAKSGQNDATQEAVKSDKAFDVISASSRVGKPDALPYGPVEITAPIVCDWGADFVELIHATPAYAVGWGHMGLFVYSVKEKKLTGAVDVKAIGCDATQGDNYTDVFVGDEDRVVYMHPIDKDYMFAYNILENTLEKQKFVDGGNGRPEGVKVDDNRQNMTDIMGEQVPDIWISSECEIFTVNADTPDEKKYLGYLSSGNGEIGALTYVMVEWDDTENEWSSKDGAIWCPHIEEAYYFFEGEDAKLLWQYTEDSRMYFVKTANVSAKGLTLGLYNMSAQQVLYGEEYHLYSYVGGDWEELPYLQESAFNAVAYTLGAGETAAISIDWTWLYGELPAGSESKEYRLVKKIQVPRSTETQTGEGGDTSSEYEEVELTVEFTFPALSF